MSIATKAVTPDGSNASVRRPDQHRRFIATPYYFIAAAGLYMLLLVLVPMGYEAYLSMTNARLLNLSAHEFIGLNNYAELLVDPNLHASVRISVVYTILTVVLAVMAGVVCALVVNRPIAGRAIGRAVLTVPWAVPSVAAAIIFTWIFNKETGVLNRVMESAGWPHQGWLTEPGWGMAAVVAVSVWKTFPFVMLVVLAALQSVPEELYEAARMDQAGAYNTFEAITLPHIAPAVGVVSLLMAIWAFRRFEIIWLLTQGGPLNATNTLVIDVFRESFINGEIGRGAAVGIVGLAFSMLITLVYFRFAQERPNHA